MDKDSEKAMLSLVASNAQASIIMANKLVAIAKSLKADVKQFYVAIPDGGGMFSLQAGATEMNFHEGQIINPDGSINTMRRALKTDKMEVMRSLVFTTYGDIKLSLDGAPFFDLEAGEKFGLSDFDFKSLYIDATAACYVKVIAATTPQMTFMYDRYAAYDLMDALGPLEETLYDVPEIADQTITLDTEENRYRTNVEAHGTASASTSWTLEVSNDNSHWFTVDEDEGTEYNWGGHNATRYIRLTSSAAGVAGNTVSLVLTATR